jgi:type I restriction enzyme S subunit
MVQLIELKDLFAQKIKNLNPDKFKEETFELFSIAAYDKGITEILKGKEIGSSKKVLEKNDVILSRIVPHIKRCWIVSEKKEYCQIGSGEWIIFRNDNILPDYLRYFLISKPFHSMFMNTVKGVGGSLLRADPKLVGKFKIPLPVIEKQKKISEILDDAYKVINKTNEIIENYEKLAKSIFLDMFGNNDYEQIPLDKLALKITDGTHHTPKYTDSGIPFLRVTDITKSNDSKKYISKEEHLQLIKRCNPEFGDVLYTKNGTIGVAKVVDWNYDFSVFVSLCLIKLNKNLVEPKFIESFLNTHLALRQAMSHSKTGTITNLHLIEIKKIKCPLPSLELQNQFTEKISLIEKQIELAKKELKESENLFNCLIQKAFKGELV